MQAGDPHLVLLLEEEETSGRRSALSIAAACVRQFAD